MGERGRGARVGVEEMRTPCFEAQNWRLHVLLRATTYPVKAGGERRSILPDLCLGPRGRYESVFRKIKQAFCFGLLGFEHGLKSDCPTGLTVGSSCILLVLI